VQILVVALLSESQFHNIRSSPRPVGFQRYSVGELMLFGMIRDNLISQRYGEELGGREGMETAPNSAPLTNADCPFMLQLC
jgi:hypothetical protein